MSKLTISYTAELAEAEAQAFLDKVSTDGSDDGIITASIQTWRGEGRLHTRISIADDDE